MLRIRIDGADVEGSFEGRQGPTLAEVEVIAQVAGDAAPRVSFTRGDTDCDGNVNITDAIVLLNALFLNGPRLCCASAADTNVDARIDLTDGIIIADYLFLGRAGPRPPFPDCGRVPEGSFSCGIETCP
jgi:hypothetical protein